MAVSKSPSRVFYSSGQPKIFSNGMHLAAEFEDHDVFTRTLISLVHFQVAMPKRDSGLAAWHSCAMYFDIVHGWLEPRSRRIIQKPNARCCRKWSDMLPHGWSWLFGLSLLRMDKSCWEDGPCTVLPMWTPFFEPFHGSNYWILRRWNSLCGQLRWRHDIQAKFEWLSPAIKAPRKAISSLAINLWHLWDSRLWSRSAQDTPADFHFQFSCSRNSGPSATRRRDRERSYHFCCRGNYALSWTCIQLTR